MYYKFKRHYQLFILMYFFTIFTIIYITSRQDSYEPLIKFKIPSSSIRYSTISYEKTEFHKNQKKSLVVRYFKSGKQRISETKIPLTGEIKTQLNVRKLVLFAVNEINVKLAEISSNCVKYWVNPLNIEQVEEEVQNISSKLYIIRFTVEPGQIQFEAVVEQNTDREQLYRYFELGKQTELKLLYAKVLHKPTNMLVLNCYNESLSKASIAIPTKFVEVEKLCLCFKNRSADFITNLSNQARRQWNTTDIELFSWPPNVPMFVSNYVKFGVKEFYLHTPNHKNICSFKLKMIIMISSAPNHFTHRKLIRETYGNKTLIRQMGVGLLFFFGKVTNTTLQDKVASEILEFNDIVQVDYLDSYHNLTLSHLMMYNWIYTFCTKNQTYFPGRSLPKWLLKADDDVLINVELSLKITKANPDIPLMGNPFCRTKPVRDVNYMTKYYVPKYMYAPDWYICYFSGLGYLIQSKLIPKFLQASLTTPIIHMDDAYVTGLLPLQLGICITGFPGGYFVNYETPCELKKTVISYSAKGLEEQWKNLNSLVINCTFDFKVKITNPEPKDECIFHPR